MTASTGRTWTFDFNAPDKWLNENDRLSPFAKARIVAQWRRSAALYARHAHLPKKLDHIEVTVLCQFPGPAAATPRTGCPPPKRS